MVKVMFGVGIGILICNPEVVTGLIFKIKEKQVDAITDLANNSKILDSDLQKFLKQDPS